MCGKYSRVRPPRHELEFQVKDVFNTLLWWADMACETEAEHEHETGVQ